MYVMSRLENKSSTLCLLVTTVERKVWLVVNLIFDNNKSKTYPNSKCLQRFNESCAFVLHCVHSNLNTTFLVVLAFLWKTGLV